MANNKKNNKSINEPLTADKLEENSKKMQMVPKQDMSPAVSAKSNKKKNDKNGKKENGFVKFFKKIGRSLRAMVEELKKVTWPTFAQSLKSTAIVLVFVAIFLVVLIAMDLLFGFGFKSLIGAIRL